MAETGTQRKKKIKTMKIATFLLHAATILTTGFALSAEAQKPVAAPCVLDNPKLETHLIHDREGFFAQPLGADKILISGTWTGRNNNETPSVQYDLKSRKYTKITPGFDPYPTTDRKFYVQPSPLRFFLTSDIAKKGPAAVSVGEFPEHDGYYQSVGQTTNREGNAVYRILTAQGRGLIRDYVWNGNQMIPLPGPPVNLCQNLKGRETLDWTLPVISRDGNRFSTLNPNTGTTQIYDIEMPSGNCKLKADLGFPTGKVSFSFDQRFVTFPSVLRNGGYRVAYIYDIETKKSRLATPPNLNREVYYSTFFPDGRVGVMYFRTLSDELTAANAVQEGVSKYGHGQPVMTMVEPSFVDTPTTPLSLKIAGDIIRTCREMTNLLPQQIIGFLTRETCTAIARSNSEIKLADCAGLPAITQNQNSRTAK